MKFPWTMVATILVSSNLMASIDVTKLSPGTEKAKSQLIASFSEGDIRANLAELALPNELQFTRPTVNHIKRYLKYGQRESKTLLGRSKHYFPVFDHYLDLYQLPEVFRYLPMIESELRPDAQSGVGASGLWQLMPETAKFLKLHINDYVDERLDPYRSTRAATKMLSRLYHEYCDINLVLAAYNCGGGRVNKAIRQAGSMEYEKLKQFLPQETQKYVPRFIAAAYTYNYHEMYGIHPKVRGYDFRELRTLMVYQYLSFGEIAKIADVDIDIVKELNPSYLRNVLPKTQRGNFLTLPSTAIPLVKAYLKDMEDQEDKEAVSILPGGKMESIYIVKVGEHVGQIAFQFNCDIEDIMRWNGLSKAEVFANQELIIYLPERIYWARA